MKNPLKKLKQYANDHQLELTILACAGTAIAATVVARNVYHGDVILRNDFIADKGLNGEFLAYIIEGTVN